MNLKLSLTGPAEAIAFGGLTLRFMNAGDAPLAVIRSLRPGFYASHEVRVRDAAGRLLRESRIVHACGAPYPLTEDAIVVVPPGGSLETGVDTRGYTPAPGAYQVQVTYRTNDHWLKKVVRKPSGFEHLAEGAWTSNALELLVK